MEEFLDSEGNAFFSTAGSLGVMLNVDWFQPYKHTNHSCGVIYLVPMNRPREERFKPENVIIVGIIPGPKEPKGDINSFLNPLVDVLIDFWDGVIIADTLLPGGMFRFGSHSWHYAVMCQLLGNVEDLQVIQQQKVPIILISLFHSIIFSKRKRSNFEIGFIISRKTTRKLNCQLYIKYFSYRVTLANVPEWLTGT